MGFPPQVPSKTACTLQKSVNSSQGNLSAQAVPPDLANEGSIAEMFDRLFMETKKVDTAVLCTLVFMVLILNLATAQ